MTCPGSFRREIIRGKNEWRGLMISPRTDSHKDLYTTGSKTLRQWMMVKLKNLLEVKYCDMNATNEGYPVARISMSALLCSTTRQSGEQSNDDLDFCHPEMSIVLLYVRWVKTAPEPVSLTTGCKMRLGGRSVRFTKPVLDSSLWVPRRCLKAGFVQLKSTLSWALCLFTSQASGGKASEWSWRTAKSEDREC